MAPSAKATEWSPAAKWVAGILVSVAGVPIIAAVTFFFSFGQRLTAVETDIGWIKSALKLTIAAQKPTSQASVKEVSTITSERRAKGVKLDQRPSTWQHESFTLRAPAAKPPCGDLCFVWEGTPESLNALLDRAGAKIIEGPVARQGGRRKAASSVYIRDPDGNLLEFMIYP